MTATTEELRAAFEHFTAALDRKHKEAQARLAQPYRARGWNDLADVIENEEGRQIVRNNMQHILDWTN